MSEPIESAELLAFVTVLEAGSLARAALQLGIPRATLSRRLARLEERLLVRLIRRSTRQLSPTEAGLELLPRARTVLDSLREAEAAIARDDPRLFGTLRVSVPSFGDERLAGLIVGFAAENPDLRVEVNQSAAFVDMRTGAYDVVIRASADPGPGLTGRVIARDRIFAVASGAYLKANGTPSSVDALSAHRCLVGYARGELPDSYWPLCAGGRVHVRPAMAANSPQVLLEAAKRGLGIALVPGAVARVAVAAGEVVTVLPDSVGADVQLSVLYLDREFVPRAVRAFVVYVSAWAKREPLLMPFAIA